MLQYHQIRNICFFILFVLPFTGCQHKKTALTSRWQVSYFGTQASVNRSNDSGETVEADLQVMDACTPVEPNQVRCVSKDGMAVLFTGQNDIAQLYGKSKTAESPLGTINLVCRSPFVDGQPVICDQAATQ